MARKPIIIGIYKITSPSGRIYVGQSGDINKRWDNDYKYGKCKGQKSLYNSFQEYGVKNHTFEIIEVIQERETEELTQLELDAREIFFIAKFNTRDKKFGMNLKGGGSHGKHSEETKLKLSLAHKGIRLGFIHSEETKSKIGLGNKGKIVSEESRIKLSLAKFGKKNPKIAGKKNGMSKGHTEATKLQMSLDRKGKVAPNRIYAVGENHALFGKKHSDETREKISIKNSVINHPRYGKFGKENPLSKKVVQFSLLGSKIRIWNGMSDVQRELNIDRSKISAVCRGKLKTTGGFKWEYFENNLTTQ